MIGIYKYTNKINGKIYIGKSIDISRRFRQHLKNKTKYPIDRAIRKYGITNFDFNIVHIIDDTEDSILSELEKHYIKKYKSRTPNGYNLTDGGEGMSGYLRDKTEYEFYHPKYGIVKATQTHMIKTYKLNYAAVSYLVSEQFKHAKEWILSKDITDYDKIMNIHTFYHSDYGTFKVSCKKLRKMFGKEIRTSELARDVMNVSKGWSIINKITKRI